MGNKKWTRVLALMMAVVCTLTMVAAAGIDRNGDGKYTVYDLQLLFKENKSDDYADTLKQVLGGHGDELNPVDEDGKVYEIYTEFGLRNMAKLSKKNRCAGMTFKLMNNIDMRGASWTPIMFGGVFEGQGHEIQNVNIDKDYKNVASSTTYMQGFFAKLTWGAEVKNLHLRDVVVTAQEKTKFIGLLAGSSLGLVQDCTTTGTVVDERTNLTEAIYVGTLLGRVENALNPDTTLENRNVPGVKISDSSILMTAEDMDENMKAILNSELDIGVLYDSSSEIEVAKNTLRKAMGASSALSTIQTGQKVLCKMALRYAQLEAGSASRTTGIVGVAPSSTQNVPQNTDYKSYNWQDISGSTTLQDPILAARRQAVVDKMYRMCTIEWTPSQTMTRYFYKGGAEQKVLLKCLETGVTTTAGQKIATEIEHVYTQGKLYRGVPYMHAGGSLERFESWLEDGKTKTTLPTETYYCSYAGLRYALNKELTRLADPNETATYEIWTRDENNAPVEKITDAFDVTGMVRVDQGLETVNNTLRGADVAGYGRYIGNDCSQAIMWAWREVVSSDPANGGTVISGVTQMAPTADHQTRYGVLPVNGLVPIGYALEDWEATYTTYGKDEYMEGYAQASRGDALICNASAGGHSRMIAYDPITIRNWKGVIQADLSYIITHEQGRGSSGSNWKSDCYANCLYTFEQLTYDREWGTGIGVRGHYMPMTLPVFHDVNSKAADTDQTTNSYIKWENGAIKSNFYILSTKVGDAPEVFTGVTQHQSTTTLDASGKEVANPTYVGHGYRDARVEVTLAELIEAHGDVAGQTVTVKLSNGYIGTVTIPAA